MRTAGILLAGGQSSRFGSPKAFAVEQSAYYYEYAYAALESVCTTIVIVTLEELRHRFPEDRHVIIDCEQFSGRGPLAGIYSGMLELDAARYVVLPCDMPFIASDGLASLLAAMPEGVDVSAVHLDSRRHPLVSCWSRSMREPLQLALEEQRHSVLQLLDTVRTLWLDGESLFADAHRALRNINRPE